MSGVELLGLVLSGVELEDGLVVELFGFVEFISVLLELELGDVLLELELGDVLLELELDGDVELWSVLEPVVLDGDVVEEGDVEVPDWVDELDGEL